MDTLLCLPEYGSTHGGTVDANGALGNVFSSNTVFQEENIITNNTASFQYNTVDNVKQMGKLVETPPVQTNINAWYKDNDARHNFEVFACSHYVNGDGNCFPYYSQTTVDELFNIIIDSKQDPYVGNMKIDMPDSYTGVNMHMLLHSVIPKDDEDNIYEELIVKHDKPQRMWIFHFRKPIKIDGKSVCMLINDEDFGNAYIDYCFDRTLVTSY